MLWELNFYLVSKSKLKENYNFPWNPNPGYIFKWPDTIADKEPESKGVDKNHFLSDLTRDPTLSPPLLINQTIQQY